MTRSGHNPTAYLRERKLIGAFDFLRPDDLIASSLFLFTKTEEGALGMISAAIAIGPTFPTG